MPLPSRYRLVDLATQGYLLFVALVALVARGEHWAELVAAHVGVIVLVHLLIASDRSAGGADSWRGKSMATAGRGWLREFYPILLYTGLYVETVLVNRMIAAPRIDPWLLRADHALFGCEPAEVFPIAFAHPLFSELMYVSYLAYYGMVGGVGLWLSLRNRNAFRHFVTVVSLVFYGCYALYLFVPAVGPRIIFVSSPERTQFIARYGHEPRAAAAGGDGRWAQRAFAVIEERGEIPGAAFPSSHVAVALVTAWFSWRHLRRIRWLHLGFAIAILFAAVYTRAHYAVDILGGLAAAAGLFPAAQALDARFGGGRQTARA